VLDVEADIDGAVRERCIGPLCVAETEGPYWRKPMDASNTTRDRRRLFDTATMSTAAAGAAIVVMLAALGGGRAISGQDIQIQCQGS
jgi:hypothetical protein